MKLLDGIQDKIRGVLDEAQQLVGRGKSLRWVFDRSESSVQRLRDVIDQHVGLIAFFDLGHIRLSKALGVQRRTQVSRDEGLVRPCSESM